MIRFLVMITLMLPLAGMADRYDDAVGNPDRPEADLARDEMRQPATVLRTIGVDEGLTVLDAGAGGGYYSELLSYAVGESGEVIMQTPSAIFEIFPNLKPAVTGERLAANRLPNVRLIDSEMVDLGLADDSVDLVLFHLIYHDMIWIYPGQMDVLNSELLRVVKPGGRVVIIDHDSAEGVGDSQTLTRADSTHRVEDTFIENMMTSAGFKLIKSSNALRNPDDDHTMPFFAPEMRGKPTDRFFHIYQR